MTEGSPLVAPVLVQLGPVPLTLPVVTTWGLMAALCVASYLATRRRDVVPGRLQAVAEVLVEVIEAQLREVLHADPRPVLPLVGTLFLYVLTANLAGTLPGIHAPTGSIETPLALAGIVFGSVHVLGIHARGIRAYLGSFLEPTPLLLPLNVISEITRTFSLAIRLFGNMMSHELVLGVVVTLAGLLVPVPLMVLGILIGLVQAYIFSVLATVYIGGGTGSIERG